ncbi:MAG: hypothetical protein EBZ47_08255, partial [Chlamydiae bacterium]|nr:hypothetical protein [Chlamydiota bacterium]
MVRYMRSISIVIYMMGVVGINIYASDDRIEEIDNPSAIKFKSFVYDPSSKRFDGDFFEEAGHVFRELGAYYTGKYKRVVYENLPQAQDKLKSVSMDFDKKELNTLRSQKWALEERNEKLTDKDLDRYKTLKKQEGEILLQKTIIERFDVKTQKYDKRRIMMTDMSEWLQKIFYLAMLQPHNFCINDYPYYISETDEVYERKTISCNISPEQIRLFSKIKPEGMEGINLKEMKKTCDYVFTFLDRYSTQLLGEKSDRIKCVKGYIKAQAFINSNKFDQFRHLLKVNNSFSIENVSNMNKIFSIKSLRQAKKVMENEVKPLAQFYDSFVETLESFQKEIEERNKKDTVI